MKTLLAESKPLGPIGSGEGFGPFHFGKIADFSSATNLLESILSKVIAFMTICGSLWFIFQFIAGTYSWMSSGGNQESLKAAKDRIIHAVTGLLILVAAYALIYIIGLILGIDILNPGRGLQTIQ